MIARKPITSL